MDADQGGSPMAKQKATSGVAAKTAVRKKWTGLRTAAKPAARKTIKSKAHVSASKHKVRPQQRIAISHHREEDFKATACGLTQNTATLAYPMRRTAWRRRM